MKNITQFEKSAIEIHDQESQSIKGGEEYTGEYLYIETEADIYGNYTTSFLVDDQVIASETWII